MPTPMPIIASVWFENVGIVMRFTVSPTRAMPQPMPNSAVMIGRPMASTEPNASSRMIAAASRPIASLENSAGSAKISPPSSTCTPSGRSATAESDVTMSRTVSPASVNSLLSRSAMSISP
jgi:hypothetical protein